MSMEQNVHTLADTVEKTISELKEISSRSEQTDARLSAAFFKGVLLFLRHNKQTLMSAVMDTCARLRVHKVQEMLVWATDGGLAFQKIEGLVLPVVVDKTTAIYAFVGHKKSGASLFTLLDMFQVEKQKNAKKKKAAAAKALAESELIFAMQATKKALETCEKKFPKHALFFSYLRSCMHNYKE